MIGYRRQGRLPEKPHTVFRKRDGSLYVEHCFTRDGFDGPFSILYHEHPPQAHGGAIGREPLWPGRIELHGLAREPLRRRHLRTQDLAARGTPTTGRDPLLFNDDVTVGVLRPTGDDDFYFANGDGDELLYIHEGGGELLSWFGRLRFGPGDYVVIPRAVVHRVVLERRPQHWLWVECRSGVGIPAGYRNCVGQLRMDAPYTHRDFRTPTLEGGLIDPDRGRMVVSKRADRFSEHTWPSDVLDTVGWDGAVYPFVLPIGRFSPKVGQVHLPATVHGTFATARSLICSYVPRAADFGEGAIPSAYPHTNVGVDEVVLYGAGDLPARGGVTPGSMTHHPAGVPHGPQPGAYAGSVGARVVRELSVMLHTTEPLLMTARGRALEVPHYDESFHEGL